MKEWMTKSLNECPEKTQGNVENTFEEEREYGWFKYFHYFTSQIFFNKSVLIQYLKITEIQSTSKPNFQPWGNIGLEERVKPQW